MTNETLITQEGLQKLKDELNRSAALKFLSASKKLSPSVT